MIIWLEKGLYVNDAFNEYELVMLVLLNFCFYSHVRSVGRFCCSVSRF